MTNTRAEKFLNKIIEQATHKRRQLNGVKTQNILLHKKEAMTEQDLIVQNKQVTFTLHLVDFTLKSFLKNI